MSGEFFPNVIKDALSGHCGCGFFLLKTAFLKNPMPAGVCSEIMKKVIGWLLATR